MEFKFKAKVYILMGARSRSMKDPKNECFNHNDFWSRLYLNIKASFVSTDSKVVQEDMWVNVGMDRNIHGPKIQGGNRQWLPNSPPRTGCPVPVSVMQEMK